MKSNIFLVAIFLLIAGGIYMFTNDGKSEESEVEDKQEKYLGAKNPYEERVKEQEPQQIEKQLNVSATNWGDSLIGVWNFSVTRKSPKAFHELTGEIEYLVDGTFIRHVTHKYYIPRFDDYVIDPSGNNKLAIVAGGNVKGKWKVSPEEKVWKETITSCNISPSFTLKDRREHRGYSTCKKDFSGVNQYGTYTTQKTKFSLSDFRNGVINITGKNFKEGSEITHSMWKPKNQ